MNIAFIGLGQYGSALASLVSHNGHIYDYAEATEGRLLSSPADLVFLTVPTRFIRQALQENAAYLREDTVIVNCSKGIEEETHLLVHQIVQNTGVYGRYYSLIGPSFAEGILAKEPTVVSLGYRQDDDLVIIKDLLETPYFKVRASKGYRALELASALKNLYAITCGYAVGAGFGPNTQARLIMQALEEFEILAKAMHFSSYEIDSPGILGDLLLTCMSGQSRNYKYGLSLADPSIDAIDPTSVTVEGYHTSHSIGQIAQAKRVQLPLAAVTANIISGDIRGKTALTDYLGRI